MDVHDRALAIGNASLTGVRGRVARSVSESVARRTRLSREEVQAILGFLLLACTAWSARSSARHGINAPSRPSRFDRPRSVHRVAENAMKPPTIAP